ncbi:MAG: hypothetical protein IPP71_22365 [Bacteroidetes bacterium]|nr:hypothetical protein [Bacteroidota bacterium]
MFAIALYNPTANKVQLFRDRAGVKPLFYYWDGELFLFGSELKAFHQHPGFKKQIDFDSLAFVFPSWIYSSPLLYFQKN